MIPGPCDRFNKLYNCGLRTKMGNLSLAAAQRSKTRCKMVIWTFFRAAGAALWADKHIASAGNLVPQHRGKPAAAGAYQLRLGSTRQPNIVTGAING